MSGIFFYLFIFIIFTCNYKEIFVISRPVQDVVFALAHATGKIGRFTLIERWRNNERLLAPTETPLKILMKWGEYSSDVQFILQRSDQSKPPIQQSQQQLLRQQQQQKTNLTNDVEEIISKTVGIDDVVKNEQFSPIPIRSKDVRNNLNLENNIGIIKTQKTEPEYAFVTRTGEFNSADIRNSLNRKISSPPPLQQDNQAELVQSSPSPPPLIGVSAIGALIPPPYRNPPKPRSSPLNQKNETIMKNLNILSNTQDFNELNDVLINNANYKDLIQLIKYQRDKIHMQQADITKFDAEIGFLENKERDQIQQLEAITREIKKTDVIYRQGGEQLQTLQYVEEENELVKQQEKTLKSEITLLRSKLANCKTELLQCKNKVRLLMDEIQIEQRVINRQYDNR